MRRTVGALAPLVAVAALLAGCGGGDAENAESPGAPVAGGPADAAFAKRANAICRDALHRTKRLGEEFSRSGSDSTGSDLLVLTTRKLVAPGIAIRERMARRLRRLSRPARGAESVKVYLELFDPIEVLSRERLRVGLDRDLDEVHRLEELMRQLAEEQSAAAHLAGLETCATDFVTEAFGGTGG